MNFKNSLLASTSSGIYAYKKKQGSCGNYRHFTMVRKKGSNLVSK